jgi:4-hydroxy-tetrahydrodipicolinate reductase
VRIALFGYGKMGRLVEHVAHGQGCDVAPILDIAENRGGSGITRRSMEGVDVAVDFSQPDAVLQNIEAATRAGVNLVVGTTGWHKELRRVEGWVLDSGIGFVYGSNFSVGMNLFFAIVKNAAQVMGKVSQYDPFLLEEHHRAKKDAPSGTALTLLELVKPSLHGEPPGIASVRAGHIPGNHTIGFDSEADTIILEHRARSRQGLAEGAILAARWIMGKKGFYNFPDVFPAMVGLERGSF